MNRKLLFAIVGCGRIAKRHAEHIDTYGMLVAVCDIDQSKTIEFGINRSISFYDSIDTMLENEAQVDVVVVCAPNALHAEHSIKSLHAGKHVLCEKPMALSADDCRKMMEASEKANRLLFVVKQNRYNPPVVAVKKILDTGKFGKLYSFQLNCFWNRDASYYANSWKGTKKLDGGTLFTQFSHFIDLMYWMFGDVETIHALTSNIGHENIIEFEDTGVVIVRMNNGMIGTINYTVNAYRKNMEGSLTIFGEKGTVKIGGQYLNTLEYECMEGEGLESLPAGNPSNDYGDYQGSMSNHDKVYENVLAVIYNNGTMDTTAQEALKTVEIINRIYKAANY